MWLLLWNGKGPSKGACYVSDWHPLKLCSVRSSILGMHLASPGPHKQDKLYLRMGRVGQQVINWSQGNLLKATVDFKLSPDWLEKGHNTIIKLSITEDINLYGDSILQKNLEHLWGRVSKTWNPEKSVVSNGERTKEKRKPRSCQRDVIEKEKDRQIRFLEKWPKRRSKEDMRRRGGDSQMC